MKFEHQWSRMNWMHYQRLEQLVGKMGVRVNKDFAIRMVRHEENADLCGSTEGRREGKRERDGQKERERERANVIVQILKNHKLFSTEYTKNEGKTCYLIKSCAIPKIIHYV